MRTQVIKRSLAVLALVGMISCASNELKNSESPEVVYNEGVRLLEDKNYLEAADFLQEVRRRFPQSRFAILSELKAADMDFMQDNFIEAAAGYGVFVDLYPNHAEAPYALYRKALSFFNGAPELIARDQSSASDAVETSRFFLKRYASSNHAKEVQAILLKSRLKLAEKEAYIARFYRKKEAYESSLRRWKALYKDFSDISSSDEGSKLLNEAKENVSELETRIKGESST
jgi:outer membrane protein assembly factor BamD